MKLNKSQEVAFEEAGRNVLFWHRVLF